MAATGTGPAPSPAPSTGPGGAVPWYRDPLFAATVGAWILAAVNQGSGLDLPTTGTVAVGVGMALLWGIHVVVLDLEALRAGVAHRQVDVAQQNAAAEHQRLVGLQGLMQELGGLAADILQRQQGPQPGRTVGWPPRRPLQALPRDGGPSATDGGAPPAQEEAPAPEEKPPGTGT